MAITLVILESPGKVKAVSKYLGNDYQVVASNGHIIDLPEKEIGVDIENDFSPTYKIINNGQAYKTLKKIETLAKKSDKILIATDPDREGEAIGWHIANRLKTLTGNIKRVTFNEITKKGVEAGISNEGDLNMSLVDSQQARRIMDRLVGYKVSPFLWKTISSGLSAGRVQSVALKIICERDKEIADFNPEEYWSIHSDFAKKGEENFMADLVKISGKDFKITSKEEVEKIAEEILKQSYSVTDITKKVIKKSPQAPFITSTLLQESIKKLGFSSKKTMQIAQQLYEGVEIDGDGFVGLITYMRTDSTRISKDANEELREFIKNKFGEENLAKKERLFKSKKNIQDAHEAIRPTNIAYEPSKIERYLSNDQKRLYRLIWTRFVATQMAEAKYQQTVAEIEGGEYKFRTTGRINTHLGYLSVYSENGLNGNGNGNSENGENGNSDKIRTIPKFLKKGVELDISELFKEQHFTKPPARFNEASLTKELEEDEIGRPSTYSTIIEKLIVQKYVEKKEKKLFATELGFIVSDILTGNFPNIFNIEFTKQMESELDKIEYDKEDWIKVLKDFYEPFSSSLGQVMKMKNEIKEKHLKHVGKSCPTCKEGDLIYKWGKNGKFIACSRFPKCRYTASIDDYENPEKKPEPKVVGKCDKCGGNLVEKVGRYGKFVACDNYPKCKNIVQEDINVPCPEDGCDGKIVEKKSKKKRRFYGCTNFPNCKFVSWSKPVDKKCPACGYKVMTEKVAENKTVKFVCPKCKHETE